LASQSEVFAADFFTGIPRQSIQHRLAIGAIFTAIKSHPDLSIGRLLFVMAKAAEPLDHLGNGAAELISLLAGHLRDCGSIKTGKRLRVRVINETMKPAVYAMTANVWGRFNEVMPAAHMAHNGADQTGRNVGLLNQLSQRDFVGCCFHRVIFPLLE